MPGNLYFYRENDIIHLLRVDYIGTPGMIPYRPGVGSTGAVLFLKDKTTNQLSYFNNITGTSEFKFYFSKAAEIYF